MRTRQRAVGLAEPVEGVLEELGRHALSRIPNLDLERVVAVAERDDHAPARRRELDRVRDQVPDDLLDAVGIAQDPVLLAGMVVEAHLDLLAFGGEAHRVHRGPDHGGERRRLQGQPELAGDDARDVEQVVDQLGLRRHVALDHLESAVGPIGVESPGAQEPRPAHDRRERRPELVRERRQKLVLHPVGFPGFGVDGVFDGDGAHLRELRQHAGLVVSKVAVALVENVKQTEGPAVSSGQGRREPARPRRPSLDVVRIPVRSVVAAGPSDGDTHRRKQRDHRCAVAHDRPLPRLLRLRREGDGAPGGGPLFFGSRDRHGLMRSEDAAGEVRGDLECLAGRQRGVDGQRRLRQLLELRRATLEDGGLRLDLGRLLEELDEHHDLRAEDFGLDRRENVVDRSDLIPPRRMRVVGIRRDEDDRGVLGALALPDERRGLEAVHRRHVDVEQHHGVFVLENEPESLAAGGGRVDVLAELGEQRRKGQQLRRVVVDREQVDPVLGLHGSAHFRSVHVSGTARSGAPRSSRRCPRASRGSPRRRPGGSSRGRPSWPWP